MPKTEYTDNLFEEIEDDDSDISDDEEEEQTPFSTEVKTDLFTGPRTKSLPEMYENEQQDASPFRGEAMGWSNRSNDNVGIENRDDYKTQFSQIATRYLDPEEMVSSQVGVKNGKLVTPSGESLDTSGATGIGTQERMGQGKHIFTMGGDDVVRSMDAWGGHRETAPKGNGEETPALMGPTESQYTDENGELESTTKLEGKDLKRLEMLNHSSLVQGGDVKGAGELTVDQGKLIQVSDLSGHYKPDAPMTNQVLEHFGGQGVDMHDVAVKLAGKDKDKKEQPLYASARELMEHGDDVDGEKKMRSQREAIAFDLKIALMERQERFARGEMRMGGDTVSKTDEEMDPLFGKAPPKTRIVGPQPKVTIPKTGPRQRGGRVQDLIGVFGGMY